MGMVMQMLCMAGSALFEFYLLYDFFHGIFEYKEWFEKPGRRIFLTVFLVVVSLGMNLLEQNAVTLLSGIVTGLLFVFCVFQGNVRQKLYYWFFLWFLMFFMEYLFTILLRLEYKKFAENMYGSKFMMAFIVLAVKMMTFIIYLLIKKKIHVTSHYMDSRTFWLYMLLPVSTTGIFLSVVYFSNDIYEITAGNLILTMFAAFAFIADILLYYVYNSYATLTEQNHYQEQQLLRLNALQDNYENLEKEETYYKGLLHNMKHYLMLIGSYADEEKNEDILRVLKELQLEISAQGNYVYCRDKLMNRILLDWKKKAENTGSSFQILCDPGFSLPTMRDMDMFTLFGNLFDNAVEAAQKVQHGNIGVKMRMCRDGKIAIVRIKNTYNGRLEMDNGKLQTGKEDKRAHGIGLGSVERIVRKYGGIVQIKTDKEFFETILMFYL